MFRAMNQVSKLYNDVVHLSYKFECGERVEVTIFLEKIGSYYNYSGIGLGHEYWLRPGVIGAHDYLIGHKGCYDFIYRPSPQYPKLRQEF